MSPTVTHIWWGGFRQPVKRMRCSTHPQPHHTCSAQLTDMRAPVAPHTPPLLACHPDYSHTPAARFHPHHPLTAPSAPNLLFSGFKKKGHSQLRTRQAAAILGRRYQRPCPAGACARLRLPLMAAASARAPGGKRSWSTSGPTRPLPPSPPAPHLPDAARACICALAPQHLHAAVHIAVPQVITLCTRGAFWYADNSDLPRPRYASLLTHQRTAGPTARTGGIMPVSALG